MKKRFLSLMLAFTTSLCIVSCGNKARSDAPTGTVQFVDEVAEESGDENGLNSNQEMADSDYDLEDLESEAIKNRANDILSQMSLEEKVGQMFITRPENQGNISVGGICIFADNISSADGLKKLIEKQNRVSKTAPFISVDEEGGRVSRIANSGFFDVPMYTSMQDVGSEEDAEGAKIVGRNIGAYLGHCRRCLGNGSVLFLYAGFHFGSLFVNSGTNAFYIVCIFIKCYGVAG